MESVLARQVTADAPEGEYFGHFRAFDGYPFTEKAWSHHQFGFNCGLVFPHYVLPLLMMLEGRAFPDRAQRWQTALENFAYHYFLPACRANPFWLLPNGYFTEVGLIWFCGLGHGMNAAYGWAAVLALEFARFFRDPVFHKIAFGDLQWIAGLNAGLTRESLAGSWKFRAELPEGVAVPCSMIHRVGDFTAGSWLDIPGSICNGFDVDEQFKLNTEPSAAVDAPRLFTDEDWITHAGAWLSAVARCGR